MDLNRKLEMHAQAVASIATHDDVDAAVRKAALAKMRDQIDEAEAAIDARVKAEVDTLTKG